MPARTPYFDVHHRIIYKSASGAYFVKDALGKKHYGIKARYVTANGSTHKLTTKNVSPPSKIAPKRVAALKVRTSTRKVRSNAGKKRVAYKPRMKKSGTPKKMTSPQVRNALMRTMLARRLRKVTFTFRPKVGMYGDSMRDEALKWYKMMASDVEAAGEVKILSMMPVEKNKIAVSFRFQPAYASKRTFSMPGEIKSAIESIIDPDQDGNEPIMVKGEPQIVMGSSPHVVSIGM